MPDAAAPRREGLFALGLLLVSAAVLLLEVGQVRIFSFLLWHHVTYLVVTVTLLGFAAGGTFLSLRHGKTTAALPGKAATMFGLLAALTFAVMARQESVLLAQTDARFPALKAALSYLYLVLPYFCGGLAIAASLDGEGAVVSRRYGVNMIGSALGALLALPVLRTFGGPGIVLVAAALAFAGSALQLLAIRQKTGVGGLVAAACALFLLGRGDALFPFPCAVGKTLEHELTQGKPLVYSKWDPICRIDVVGDEEKDVTLRVYQDGDAPTHIPSAAKVDLGSVMQSHLALGYLLKFDPATQRSRDRALVIGVGGGHDIKTALVMGAQRVVGAEINRSTAEMMRGRFGPFSGNLYTDPRVAIEVADGRSVVARSDETFDIVQITGADTYAALATGANLTAESYLYTQDAIRDYFDHLADDGVLCLLRWRFFPPRETLRLVGMIATVLKERGVADPRAHLAVVNVKASGVLFDGKEVDAHYAVTIAKKTPLTAREIQIVRQFVTLNARKDAYSLAFLPNGAAGEGEKEFTGYLAAIAEGPAAAHAFVEAYPYAIEPVTDDRPFFFQFFRGSDVLGSSEDGRGKEHFFGVIGQGPEGLRVLWLSLAGSIGLVLLLVVIPLGLFRREGLKVSGAPRFVLFFTALGLAYLAVEIATAQRLTLYLGHPLLALGVGLTSFLVASGIGAAASARVEPGNERKAIALAAILAVALLLLHAFALPAVFAATLGLPDLARQVLAAGAIAPLAFVMGMPFPLGLRVARRSAAPLLPWAFGVNGGASVVASVLAILFAMDHGFGAVLLAASGLYLLAALLSPRATAV